MPESPYYVYIMANSIHNVLYTGQTNDLLRRVWAHKQGLVEGFTRRYKVNRLVMKWRIAETGRFSVKSR